MIGAERGKASLKNPKVQNPNPNKIQNPKLQPYQIAPLELGAWCFSGSRTAGLGFGAFIVLRSGRLAGRFPSSWACSTGARTGFQSRGWRNPRGQAPPGQGPGGTEGASEKKPFS